MSPDSGEPPAPATDKAQKRPLSASHGGLSSTELDELLVNTFNAMASERHNHAFPLAVRN